MVEVHRFSDYGMMSTAAAHFITAVARRTCSLQDRWTLVLSGGTTPRRLYELLASPERTQEIPWKKTHVFWADERCVPPDHPESNYGGAYTMLLAKVGLPAENIHRIFGEAPDPEQEALRYEAEIRDFFQLRCSVQAEGFPVFDLVLLGVGADGHTASLFPGTSALEENTRWVVAVRAPHGVLPERRITLTLPVLNSAKTVLFLVSGNHKTRVVQDMLSNQQNDHALLPAVRVAAQKTVWFMDTGTIKV
jgi:6-phosphogluconolactonase